jgi:ariadne-1
MKTNKRQFKKENSLQLPPINKKVIIPKNTPIKSQTALPFEEEKSLNCETQYDYVNGLTKKVKHLARIFKISTGLALNLLIKCHYNEEEFYKVAFEKQKNKSFVNLTRMFSLTTGLLPEECPICLKETKPENLIALDCNHNFCRQCFLSYLTNLMNSEGKFCFFKTCPMENCTEYLSFEIFEELLKSDLNLLKKYQNLVNKIFMDSLPPHIRLCPFPNCSFIARVDDKQTTAICANNHIFCAKCLMFPHLPLTCKEFSFFMNSTDLDDVLANNWICNKTKKCPACNKDIEKNGGCNHMTCKMCAHQFCWVCFQDWGSHSNQKCQTKQKEIAQQLEQRKKKCCEKTHFL